VPDNSYLISEAVQIGNILAKYAELAENIGLLLDTFILLIFKVEIYKKETVDPKND
jgi:hypothetical protein